MQNKESDSFERAKNYAFLLLKFRPRSEAEISYRLKKKKFAEAAIRETISFLKEKSFLDDEYFTRAWIESRLKKPFGFQRIKQELKLKGIKEETINSQINDARVNYSEEEIVWGIAREKFNRLKNIESQKRRSRVYAYLLRRGFSSEAVINTLNKLS